ncbi:MAG: hypothetical protein ABW166_02910 [Sedimenticola sp.]
MNTEKPTYHRVVQRLWVVPLSLVMAFYCGLLQAVPPAGTEIVNQAAISYKDGSGIDRIATTNEVILTINQVFAATLISDQSLFGADGATVTFFHTLTNIGNGLDTYTITVADDNSYAGIDSGDYNLITVYHDINANGQLDADEPAVSNSIASGNLSLAMNEAASLLVVGDIPSGVADDNTYELTLTVTTAGGGMDDVGSNNDGDETTNEDTVTITSNAILKATKSSSYDNAGTADDLSDDRITYAVEVTNIGVAPATDVVVFDGIPAQMNLVAASITTANFDGGGDFSPAAVTMGTGGGSLSEAGLRGGVGADINADIDSTDASEAELSIDLNNDGDLLDDDMVIIHGVDSALASGGSVGFTYQVQYTSPLTVAAGTVIDNVAHVSGDVGTGSLVQNSSNLVQDTVQRLSGVTITDTGENTGGDQINDGRDDNALDGVQYVDAVERGATALYKNIITNTGSGEDIFDLAVTSSSFQPGTIYQYFSADGITPLLDASGNSIVDTGIIAAGASRTIMVKILLPVTATVLTPPYDAIVTVTSVSNVAKSDTVTERLNVIQPSRVDLANSDEASGFNDGGVADADLVDGSPSTSLSTVSGGTVTFDLWVANEGFETDSYLISTWADADATVSVPAGWQVVFRTLEGALITSIPPVAPGTGYHYIAEVSTPSKSTPSFTALYFKVLGGNTGSKDTLYDEVEITGVESISLQPEQNGTVPPCGSTDYLHVLTNFGDTAEDMIISVISQTLLDHQLLFPTSSVGSEATDYLPVQSFGIGDSVVIYDDSVSAWTTVTLVDDGTGGIAIPLAGSDSTRIKIRIFAPCSAPENTKDVLVLNARVKEGTASVEVTDQTTVSSVFLTISKLGARDSACDGTADAGFASANVVAAPATCVIWKLTVSNQGLKTVCNVTISDMAPPYTLLNGAPPAVIVEQPAPGDTGSCEVTGSNIDCTVGNPIDIDPSISGAESYCLRAGEVAVVHFRVQIQ